MKITDIQTRNGKFKPGYYIFEYSDNYSFYWLAYTESAAKKDPRKVNNCSHVLHYFKTQPDNTRIIKR